MRRAPALAALNTVPSAPIGMSAAASDRRVALLTVPDGVIEALTFT